MRNQKMKINFRAVMAAVAAGGGFEFAMQGIAKKVDFVNENYLVTSSLTAGLAGSGMLYFGRDEISQAAGYGLLGVSGQKGAAKLSTLIVTGDGTMNGVSKQTAAKLRGMLGRRRPGVDQVKQQFARPGNRRDDRARPGSQPPIARMDNRVSPYAAMAYADSIYSVPQF